MTVNGTRKQSLPIFNIDTESLDGTRREKIEVAGASLPDFTTIKRLDMDKLKSKNAHTKDKSFYVTRDGEYTIHMIIGDNLFCKIKTGEICKNTPDDSVVERTKFGWVIHGGQYVKDGCLFTRDQTSYKRLYSLDVLGVEDRSENDQLYVHQDFVENITTTKDGRYHSLDSRSHTYQ